VQCNNQVKQIVLALHNYAMANKSQFPPGTICGSRPTAPGNQYDVLAEAGESGPGNHGTSFLLAILPFMEYDALFKVWASGQDGSGTTLGCWSPADNIGTKDAPGPAIMDIQAFYCPTRRHELRKQDKPMMLSPEWTGGGTDYGGCAGRHAAFSLKTGYNLCDASMHYDPDFRPADPTNGKKVEDTEKSRWGIFGRVNVSTTSEEVTDGLSNTIMVGEMQRITDITPYSKDGWSVGGPATLFTTGAMVSRSDAKLTFVDSPGQQSSSSTVGKLSNNGFFGSPGSEHNNGANYGLGDGSVRYLISTMDPNIFALMGSMDDGATIGDY
jgi:prepilin-type processing-associated H-X9-DG protein